ncbi:Methyltransferase type 11 [Actinosynnema pretiosum subsp. pretiosum]|nr:Methyltransferase type 11 [Actinosynnema pretiosum subsp. pretiosum]
MAAITRARPDATGAELLPLVRAELAGRRPGCARAPCC